MDPVVLFFLRGVIAPDPQRPADPGGAVRGAVDLPAAGDRTEGRRRTGARAARTDPAAGAGGERGDREARWEAERSLEIKVIGDAPVAEMLAQHVLATVAPYYAVTPFVADVGGFRPQKF